METENGRKQLAPKEVYATDIAADGLTGTKAVIHIGDESFAVHIPIAGEHNVYDGLEKNGTTVIDDCYNANPVSMQASIDVLSGASGRRIAVLGDMGELGADERELHAMVGRHFAGKEIDAVFVTGTLAAEIAKGVREVSPATEVCEAKTKEELISRLQQYQRCGDTKGTHGVDNYRRE